MLALPPHTLSFPSQFHSPTTMNPPTLNPSPPSILTQALLSDHLHSFSDVDVIAAHVHFPCHRAVLAVHSLDFRHIFSTTPSHTSPPSPPTKFRVHINVEDISDQLILTGWRLVHAYIYGATVPLTTDAVLAALPICRRYRFDELAAILDAYLIDGAVHPTNATRVYATAAVVGKSVAPTATDSAVVLATAWAVLKSHFDDVVDWPNMPYAGLVRLLKLNDLNVRSEIAVFHAVEQWLTNNAPDDEAVAGLIKLVRFPTMTETELDSAARSPLVKKFPLCKKYLSRGFAARADEKRGLVRSVVMESSPVYRARRTDALTFSDRVVGWGRVERSVQTSSRYFAGCLWNLVMEVGDEWVGLHLGCLGENEEREMDVELDFSLFVVRHGGGEEPELVRKEVKGAGFGRSGQRIGFDRLVSREEVEREGSRLLLRDTLFIGASMRLRHSKAHVIGISADGDQTAESVSRLG